MKVGDLVRHTHRARPGKIRAIVDEWAVVSWPDWRQPDLCKLADIWPAEDTSSSAGTNAAG